MTHQEEDRFNFLGRVLFMVFFLLIICIQSNKSEKNTFFHSQYEVITEVNAASGNALCVDFIQAPIIQKSLVTFNDKTGLSLFNANFKLSCDNSGISHEFVLLKITSLSQKPISNCRFYYHLFSIDSTEPPILS